MQTLTHIDRTGTRLLLLAATGVLGAVAVSPASAVAPDSADPIELRVKNAAMGWYNPITRMRWGVIVARNNSATTLENVTASVTYTDEYGDPVPNSLGNDTWTTRGAFLERVASGENVGLIISAPDDAERWSINWVAGAPTNTPPNRKFKIVSSRWSAGPGAYTSWFTVVAKNLNRKSVKNVTFQAMCSGTQGLTAISGQSPQGLKQRVGPGKTIQLRALRETQFDVNCNHIQNIIVDTGRKQS